MASTDSAPPQGFVDGVADLQRKMMPAADPSDTVARHCDITFHFGAKDSPIIVGDLAYLRTSFPARINGWAILADRAGSLTFTVKACVFSAYPGSLASITAAAPPTGARGSSGSIAQVATWTIDGTPDRVILRDTAWEATVSAVSGGIEVAALSIRAKRLDL
jgi:hypothetical protein